MIPEPTWETVGRVAPEDVGAAGRQVQRAARWLAIAARHTIPPQPGDGHTALRWAPMLAGLATGGIEPDPGPMPGHPFRFALRPAGLSLLEVDEMGRVMQEVGLDGYSDDDVGLWVADRLAARGLPRVHEDGGGRAKVAAPPAEERDPTLLCLGDGTAFAELSRWFANAELVLGGLAASYARATPPRCWTERFELAVDVPLDGGSALGSDGPRVRAGLWASDNGAMAEPCFYVAPRPAPALDDLPEPPAGAAWHTDGVVAAVLPLSRVVAQHDRKAQQETVAGMLHDGIVRLAGG